MASVPESYSREMGVTHDDFFRTLPRAMGEHPYEVRGDSVHASVGDGALVIEIGPEQRRRIALLDLPYAEVSFRFEAVEPDARAAFKKHFDRTFQRGGG